ncbi:MAG: hypothetical protein LBD45_03775 [Bacteroidales bacterium]|jgi:hypothetical protein|nr:hypothetical protein [Bacteroidales bacterium]
MPYRRLPNTDEARIRALKAAVRQGSLENPYNLTITFKSLGEARSFLDTFEKAQLVYKQNLQRQAKENLKYQVLFKRAQLYVSHFIQVLNLCVIREEIKKENKTYYGLIPDNFAVPELTTGATVEEWGRKIIDGEQERIRRGGSPIYSPTIAKVKVHYDVFMEAHILQKGLKDITAKSLKQLAKLRVEGDKIILDIWEQIEDKYANMPQEIRLDKCKKFGIIYYLRKKERKIG